MKKIRLINKTIKDYIIMTLLNINDFNNPLVILLNVIG